MAVRRSSEGSQGSPGEESRPMRRRVKVNSNRVDVSADISEDLVEDEAQVDLEELIKNRAKKGSSKNPNWEKDFRKALTEKGINMSQAKEEELNSVDTSSPEEYQPPQKSVPQTRVHYPTPKSEYSDGILHIVSNGTSGGTIVTLNGQKLDVKVVMNLNIMDF